MLSAHAPKPMTASEYKEVLPKLLTSENANDWFKTEDKYIFCIDLLGISAHNENADRLVEDLESKLDEKYLEDLLS